LAVHAQEKDYLSESRVKREMFVAFNTYCCAGLEDIRRRAKHMNAAIKILAKLGLLSEGLDYSVLRASMVLIFYIFGYAKWHAYDVPLLTPLIKTGPLIFWLVPTFGAQGAVWFLGASEWTIGTLLLLGFWNKKLGLIGAIGSTFTFVCTVTILPFLPDAWEASVGFPAVTLNSGFLIKDFVTLAVSIYLMRQDALRVCGAGETHSVRKSVESSA
jgi:uncharacterized membrane protein YkgB